MDSRKHPLKSQLKPITNNNKRGGRKAPQRKGKTMNKTPELIKYMLLMGLGLMMVGITGLSLAVIV